MRWISFLLNFAKKSKNPATVNKYLVVGLGNPGKEYHFTRHNIGFTLLDFVAHENELEFATVKLGQMAVYKLKGKKVFLLKPATYMNLSGKAVNYWLQKEKISPNRLLVISDDLHLPFGKLRLKEKGSHAGHNGLKDIEARLQTSAYPRLRFGIGSAFAKGRQTQHVLGAWNPEEETSLPEYMETGAEIIKSWILQGASAAMSNFNTKK